MKKDVVFFLGILFFIVGVLSGSFFEQSAVPIFLLGGAFVMATFMVFRKKEILWLGVFVLTWWIGDTLAFNEKEKFSFSFVPEEVIHGEVRIILDPEERDFFQRVVLRFERCESAWCPDTLVLWQAPLSFQGEAGARLAFSCLLELPKNFDDQFDYRMFLAKGGIGSVCTRAQKVTPLESDTRGRIREAVYKPKHALERALSQTLSEPEAGLAKGLLLGGDNYLPRSLKESFTRVGLTHMIAVSGYNITLIAQMLLVLGLTLGLWRKQAIWTALVGIIFFIVMIGLPASAARAGTMASIVFVALQTGRLARPVNALLFAGGVMLFFNPLLLRYDLGFQLSFLATLGILWVVPLYERFAPKGMILKKIGEVMAMTIAVELFVLPVILFSFHTFSPLIIVGNFLVILVPVAMATAFVAAVLFLIFPGTHLFFAWSAFMVLTVMTRSVEWLGGIQGVKITVENFGLWHFVFWYVILGILTYSLSRFFVHHQYEERI